MPETMSMLALSARDLTKLSRPKMDCQFWARQFLAAVSSHQKAYTYSSTASICSTTASTVDVDVAFSRAILSPACFSSRPFARYLVLVSSGASEAGGTHLAASCFRRSRGKMTLSARVVLDELATGRLGCDGGDDPLPLRDEVSHALRGITHDGPSLLEPFCASLRLACRLPSAGGDPGPTGKLGLSGRGIVESSCSHRLSACPLAQHRELTLRRAAASASLGDLWGDELGAGEKRADILDGPTGLGHGSTRDGALNGREKTRSKFGLDSSSLGHRSGAHSRW